MVNNDDNSMNATRALRDVLNVVSNNNAQSDNGGIFGAAIVTCRDGMRVEIAHMGVGMDDCDNVKPLFIAMPDTGAVISRDAGALFTAWRTMRFASQHGGVRSITILA